jgi:hypothetical protein
MSTIELLAAGPEPLLKLVQCVFDIVRHVLKNTRTAGRFCGFS